MQVDSPKVDDVKVDRPKVWGLGVDLVGLDQSGALHRKVERHLIPIRERLLQFP